MKTVYKGGNKITLKDSEYRTSGGEGDIYFHDNLVYKIYQNPITSNFKDKFNELSILDKPNIIKPIELLFNSTNSIIGYTMKLVDNIEALSLLFTSTFLNRNNITIDKINKLITNMTETIQYIHDKGILLVDINEYNFLVDKISFKIANFIDVDSYQTKSFPATAIMPTIQDFLTKDFSKLSDWFSFAIIAFQLYTGIHPFKGKHPDYTKDKYKDKILETRMRNSISVFNKDVSIPSNVRPIDEIPDSLRSWFFDLFENKKRCIPPTISTGVVKKIIKGKIISNNITSNLIFTCDEEIIGHEYIQGNRILYTKNFIYIGNKKYTNKNNSKVLYRNGTFYFIRKEGIRKYNIEDINGKSIIIDNNNLLIFMNRIYSLGNGQLQELDFINNNIYKINSWSTNELSTKVYFNIFITIVLGSYYFYIPVDSNKCFIFLVKELKGYTIFDAYYKDNFSCIIAFKNGQYDRFIFKIENNSYSIIEIQNNINAEEINATVNNKGVFILQYENILYLTNGNGSKIIKDINNIGLITNELGDIYTYKDNKFNLIKEK